MSAPVFARCARGEVESPSRHRPPRNSGSVSERWPTRPVVTTAAAGKVPSGEIEAAEADLSRAEADVTKIGATASRMLDAAYSMARTYRESDGVNQRFWNQALFDCFRVYPDEEVEGELREEVRVPALAKQRNDP